VAQWGAGLAAALSVLVAGNAIAAAIDGPSPLGAVAGMLGFHRGDRAVHDVREAMDDLRDAMHVGDLTAARKEATRLQAFLGRLDSGDEPQVRADAARLLAQEQALERSDDDSLPATPATPSAPDHGGSTPATTTPAEPPTTDPPAAEPPAAEPAAPAPSTPPPAGTDPVPGGSNAETQAPTTTILPDSPTTEPLTSVTSLQPPGTADPSAISTS
jgi:hypothetical protein